MNICLPEISKGKNVNVVFSMFKRGLIEEDLSLSFWKDKFECVYENQWPYFILTHHVCILLI